MILGLLVVIIVGTLVVKYLKSDRGTIPEELLNGVNSIENAGKIHTVQKGENLWQIAVKYYGDGFKWIDIATENKLPNASEIEIGQELVIPEIEAVKTADVDSDTAIVKQSTKLDPITTATYEVVKGDSLWNIAVRSYGDGYKWVLIAKENKLSHPNLIHSGNVIIIPR